MRITVICNVLKQINNSLCSDAMNPRILASCYPQAECSTANNLLCGKPSPIPHPPRPPVVGNSFPRNRRTAPNEELSVLRENRFTFHSFSAKKWLHKCAFMKDLLKTVGMRNSANSFLKSTRKQSIRIPRNPHFHGFQGRISCNQTRPKAETEYSVKAPT